MKNLLEFKITDNVIKVTAFVVFTVLITMAALTFNMLIDFKNTIFEESSKKSVIVLDTVGNQQTIKMSTTRPDVVSALALSYVKKLLDYDYLNYRANLNYIKVNSSDKTYQYWFNIFKDLGKTLEFTKGSYKGIVDNMKLTYSDGVYTAYFKVEHKYLSKTKQKSITYFITIDFEYGEPTENNRIGLFATNLTFQKFKKVDPEIINAAFGGKK